MSFFVQLLGQGSSTPGFDPLSYGNGVLYLNADTMDAAADGTAISSWTDISTSAKHAVQATSGKQPILKKSIINSKSVIRWDGSDDELSGPNLATSGVLHIFAVASLRAQVGNIGMLFEQYSAGDNYGVYRDSSGELRVYNGANLAGPIALPLNQFCVIEGLINGASSKSGFNGNNNTGSAGAFAGAGSYTLGKWMGGPQYHQWDIAALIIYNADKSANAAAIRTGFAGVYNITGVV